MNSVRVFILFGAPGSGKSKSCVLLNDITDNKLKVVQKETTRPKRNTDGPEIISVENISKSCDIRYNQYNFEYGFSTQFIWDNLKNGYSVVAIVNDIRTIKILNRKFGNLSHNLYIHSNIDQDKIMEISKARYPDKDNEFMRNDIYRRIEKIKTVHRKYIENTYLFNSSIINEYVENSRKSLKELKCQLEHIYGVPINYKPFNGSTARVIIISGGSFTGKDDLVNAMIQIEPTKIIAYQKGTTRPKKIGDKDELLHLNALSDVYDIQYQKNDHDYGISVKEIWEKLSEEKIVIIVLSDLSSIMRLKQEFFGICTAIYLHANLDKDEIKIEKSRLSASEFNKRKRSASDLRSAYINNMNLFDHVLLNTSEPEDLYDQAFNILDFYLDYR